jgi:hypothetical protein
MDNDEFPRGWVKPLRRRTIAEVKALIVERQRDLAALELELFNLQQGPRLEALATIRNIMRAQQLTIDDVCSPSRAASSV